MVIKLNYKIIIGVLLIMFLLPTLFISIKNSHAKDAVIFDDDTICLPIMMYHQILNYNTGKDVITPAELESDLKYLSENNYNTLTMTQLIDFVDNGVALPDNPIILSFDDGYLNNYEYAYPLLKKYNMKIVLSIVGKSTDDFTRISDINLNYSHMTWDQLNTMIASGHAELQNHTYNMHVACKGRVGCMQKSGETPTQYEQFITEDVGKLQERIKEMTRNTPITFTYPYGKFSKITDGILRNMGYRATLSCDYGINVITKNPEGLYGLKRICRSHGKNVQKLIKDAMKTLR